MKLEKYTLSDPKAELLCEELIEFEIDINYEPKLKWWQKALNLFYPLYKNKPVLDIIKENIVLTDELGNEQAIESVEATDKKGVYNVVMLASCFSSANITITE